MATKTVDDPDPKLDTKTDLKPSADGDPEPEIEDDGLMCLDPRSAEYKEHERKGHPYNPRCKVCIMGGMRSKRAIHKPTEGEKIIRKYHQHLETAYTDTLKYNDTDVDRNKGASGVFIRKTSFGHIVQLKGFSSMEKDKAWKKASSFTLSQNKR